MRAHGYLEQAILLGLLFLIHLLDCLPQLVDLCLAYQLARLSLQSVWSVLPCAVAVGTEAKSVSVVATAIAQVEWLIPG